MESKKRLMDADEFLGKLQKLAELLKQGKISEIDINLLIASTPIVDAVEMVHGQWIIDEYKHQYCCSVCGTVQPYDSIEDYIDPDILYYDYWDCNYCPNCGAKMDGRIG